MEHAAEHVYTPSELNRELKLHLEAGFPGLVVEGEVSNLSRPASGHLYFSLKDERAQLRCAMFRSSALRATVRPENGMKVTARGRISLYEPRGEYQLIVDSLQDAGEGLLQRAPIAGRPQGRHHPPTLIDRVEVEEQDAEVEPGPEIVEELDAVQCRPADIGGYYRPDTALATAVMRPSATLNDIIG